MNWLTAAAIGAACGYLNSMASGGSAFAMPMLLLLGIPPHIANGSNRLSLVAGGLARIAVFQRAGRIRWKAWWPIIIVTMTSAFLGASLEWRIPAARFQQLVPLVLVGSLAMLLLGRKRFRAPPAGARAARFRPPHFLVAGLIGIWNGLLAIEAAAMYLILFVMGPGFSLQEANVLKAMCTFVGSVVAAAVFASHGEISWPLAAALACGNIVGAHLGARHSLDQRAQRWVYRLMVVGLTFELLWFLWGAV